MHKPASPPNQARDIFRERCEARAILVAEGLLDLPDAVCVLKSAAVGYGLIGAIGEDAVKAIVTTAFDRRSVAIGDSWGFRLGYFRPGAPDLKRSTGSGRKVRQQRAVAGNGQEERPPASTLAAAEYLFRLRDPGRLRRWLGLRSAVSRTAILRHLQHLRSTQVNA